ncbi:flagellar motor switch protein FliN [Xylanimonas oleitrophica]|uniref:Flagellar motor switch protein FliN n=1 Tax=Xylanimonas oleitrophica TaxID=2607479 RepID=A0A2W5WS12_9MICO|nr:flagellar motor switch protein FliN [Xylanimonas oleitrophica]PZR54137.1 flagellar motor switch protein FliN [Xylanimonas oleitrophica]
MNTTVTPSRAAGPAAEQAASAAAAAAALVPATVPLVAVPASDGDLPPATASAQVASFVGATSAELALVADAAISEALAADAGAAGALSPADALRPALEAAAQTLGAGLLEDSRTEVAGDVVAEDTLVFALQHEGTTLAWFTLRARGERVAPPAAAPAGGARASMRMLYDVEMTLTAEIGRTRLPVRHVLDLVPGSLLELDRTAGSPADVMVNGRLVARGEVVVVDESYGIRITEIVPGSDVG